MAIDTLKVARRLREAGFSEPQAEALVDAVRGSTEDAELATKSDIALLAAELRAEIAAVRADLSAEIAAVRTDLSAEIAAVRADMRQIDQRSDTRLQELKGELIGRMFSMILGAVLVNIVAMVGAMFAFAKLLGH